MGSASTITAIPSHVVYRVAAAVNVALALITATRRKLPLRLGEQAKPLTRQRVQLRDKLLTVVPTHPLHRPLRILELTGIVAHHRLPLLLRHLRLSDIKTQYGYGMHWFFIAIVRCGAAHLKRTTLNINHVVNQLAQDGIARTLPHRFLCRCGRLALPLNLHVLCHHRRKRQQDKHHRQQYP